MKLNNGLKNKGINLRRWTMASIVLFSITLLLLIVVWYLGRSLETPVVWNKEISGLESTIALKNNEGFILGSKNNQLSRLDKDGNEVWQTETSGTVKGLAVSEDELEVVAATEDRFLYIFDIATGKEKKKWAIPYPATTVAWSKEGTIAVSAGTILTAKHRIYTFDREGTQLWKFETSVAMRSLAFSPDGKILFVGTDSSRVFALNDLGKSLWEFTSKAPIYGIEIVGENVLYADHSGYVGALNFQGKPMWLTSYKESFIDLTGSSSGSTVMAADEKGTLRLISTKDGSEITQLVLNNGAKHIDMDQSGRNLIAVGGNATLIHVVAMESYDSILSLRRIFIIVLICLGFAALFTFTLRILFARPTIQQSVLLNIKLAAKNKIAYFLLIPTIVLLALFNYYPAYSAFYHSFTDWKPGLYTKFVGFAQFVKVMDSHYFWIGINNLVFLIVSRFAHLLVPLLVAILIFHLRSERAKYIMRNLFVYPLVVPGIVGVLLWLFIYDPNFGLLNQALSAIGLENLQHTWLGEAKTAMPALAFMGFPWIGAFALLIFYGGLISIPTDVFEAGTMDGIGKFRRFWNIELPLLMGQIRLLLILTFISTMQDFSVVYVTTQGGPFDSTYLPALELFYAATRFNDYGYASAMGIVLFLFILIGTIFQLKVKTTDQ